VRFEKDALDDFLFDRLRDFDEPNKKMKITKESDEPIDIGKCF